MPSPGDAGYGIWLDNFYCGVRSMAPFGVWLPWQEGVTLAAAFGFTENVCFESAWHLEAAVTLALQPLALTENVCL